MSAQWVTFDTKLSLETITSYTFIVDGDVWTLGKFCILSVLITPVHSKRPVVHHVQWGIRVNSGVIVYIGSDITTLNYHGGTGYIRSYFICTFWNKIHWNVDQNTRWIWLHCALFNIYLDIHRYVSHGKIQKYEGQNHDTRFEWPVSILYVIMTEYPFFPFKTHKTSAKNPHLLTIAGAIWFCRYRHRMPSQLWMHAHVAKECRLMTSQYPIFDRTDNLNPQWMQAVHE